MAKMFTQTHHNVTVHVHCHPCHNLTDYITRPVLYLPLDLPQKNTTTAGSFIYASAEQQTVR